MSYIHADKKLNSCLNCIWVLMAENCRMQPSTFSGFLYLHHCKNSKPHQKVELKFNFLASCHWSWRYYLCKTLLSMVFDINHFCIIKFSFSKHITNSIILCIQFSFCGQYCVSSYYKLVHCWDQCQCGDRADADLANINRHWAGFYTATPCHYARLPRCHST